MIEEEELPESLYLDTIGMRAAMSRVGSGGGHAQKATGALMTCPSCTNGTCEGCIDKVRLVLRKSPLCACKKSSHLNAVQGEANRQQILDPDTGTVHAPGLTISSDGDVTHV